jgi:hypothetical protein
MRSLFLVCLFGGLIIFMMAVARAYAWNVKIGLGV